jgi:NitT/TauT family transport system permease protein
MSSELAHVKTKPKAKGGAAQAAGQRRRSGLGSAIGMPVLSAVLGLVFWEAVVWGFEIPAYLLPAPTLIFQVMHDKWGLLMQELGFTAFASAVGFAIALVGGVATGAAITTSRTIDRMLYPWLVISHAIPKVVVAPLLIVWLGFGMQSEILFVIVFTFFPIIVNTVTGLKSADPELLQLVRSMGAGRFATMWKIRIPGALPSIFAAIKISATLAPVGAVVGEFVASNNGMGHLLIQAVGNLETPLAFAAVVVISIFGILVWYVAILLERLAIPWHASQRADMFSA